MLEKEKAKLEKMNRELEREAVKLNGAISIIKGNQEKVIEEMSK